MNNSERDLFPGALEMMILQILRRGPSHVSQFSLVEFFVSRPLPVPEAARIVRLTQSTPVRSVESFSYPEYQDYAARATSFVGIASYETPVIGLATNPTDQPRATAGMPVSGNFFSTPG